MTQQSEESSGVSKDEPYMVGDSPAMLRAFGAIRRFALTDAPVLILGETGTGKELAALAIHERSRFASGPFIAINCGGLPATLIGAELFGHEKGAFTGAHQKHIGRIEAAENGTVFLDEIGDLPLELQPHLLRFLQEKKIERLGGQKPITVNVRVIAATNANLAQYVQQGRCRADLYYRLNVLALEMPPLRERGDDVGLLAVYFARRFAEEVKRPFQGFTPPALVALREHGWPGNVRELIGCIRRAIVMTDSEWITPEALDLEKVQVGSPLSLPSIEADGRHFAKPNGRVASAMRLSAAKKQLEENLIRSALQRHPHNITRAAKDLGVARVTFYRLMQKHGIAPDELN